MEIPNDDRWEPIREFDVLLEEVVEGEGVIGALDTCTCVIIDDDLYPAKAERTSDTPLPPAERILPSCNQVESWLTVDEMGDVDLIKGFFFERFKALWPFSLWATVWASYRAGYHVLMALVLIVMIDFVYFIYVLTIYVL